MDSSSCSVRQDLVFAAAFAIGSPFLAFFFALSHLGV